MDGYKIHELRAAVLSDLHEFIPRFYYSLVRTNDDLALCDVWLAKRLLYVQRTAPQFTPRQLTAIRVLEKIGMYSCRYESPDPKSDAAEGITPESIKASCLEDLNDAITRYAKYLPEHEAKVWLVTTLAVVEQVATDAEVNTNSNPIPTSNWKLKIQAEAARRWKELVTMGCSPTRNSIKDDLATWCRNNKVTTDGGIFPRADYIYRHVIRAAIWKPPTN